MRSRSAANAASATARAPAAAVRPFERLRDRNKSRKAKQKQQAQPTDLIFPKTHRELFNTILKEEELKMDREGQPRTAYSLRHTYICLRLMEGAGIYQIAKNCRTSVEMIEKVLRLPHQDQLRRGSHQHPQEKPAKKTAKKPPQES